MNKKNKNSNQEKEEARPESEEDIDIKTESLENDKIEERPKIEESTIEEQLATAQDQVLRALAESENLRRRLEKEKEDLSNYVVSNFAKEILSVLDNLQRALKISIEDKKEEKNSNFNNFAEGVELTEKQLISVLEKFKINKINTVGKKFNPNFHQAMFEVEGKKDKEGEIAEVIQEGYTIGERLLRPAMVGVYKSKKS